MRGEADMFPTTNNGANTNLVTQPIAGDTLTRYFRSISNQMGQTGAGAFNTGAGVFGQGVGGVGTAQGTAGTALGTYDKAMGTVDPAAAYWQAILQGGPAATAAIAPYATQVGTNYANANSTAQSMLPKGGYSSTVQAQLPFAQARDVNNSLLQLQPQAAQQLNTIAGTQGGLAGGQAGVGGLQGNLASLLLQGGLGQEGVGSNLLQSVLQGLLQKMGINVTESGQNKQLAASLLDTAGKTASNIYNTTQVGSKLPSDIRIKEHVSQKADALKDVLSIPVYEYNFIGQPSRETGVMAQELNEIMPSAVIPGDEERIWMVDYRKLVPLLIAAVQEQQQQIAKLREQVGR
jgi:hypothetical protein